MPAPIDVLLSRLSGVKTAGKGKWMARTPTREDRTPSLSIRECEDGRVLLYDFGGDATADVLAAIGMTFTDLYPRNGCYRSRQGPSRAAIELERQIVTIGQSLLAQGRQLFPSQMERLQLARRRLVQLGEHA